MNTSEREFRYYLDNQEQLVKLYNGKFLVIKDEAVVAYFGNEREALFYAKDRFDPGTFIVQRCTPGEEDYTQAYTSRVIFA